MALTRTRQEIRDDARALADQGDSDFISDVQANHWINQELAELQDTIIAVDPARFMASTPISAVTGQLLYPLPADFYQVLLVERNEGGDRGTTLDPFVLNAKNQRDIFPFEATPEWGPRTRYLIRGQGIDGTEAMLWLFPDPGSQSYTVYYTTTPYQVDTSPASDSQAIDGSAGWLDWVVYGVAIRMKERAEEDTTGLRLDRQRIQARIELMATQRDAGRGVQPTDVRRMNDFYPRTRTR